MLEHGCFNCDPHPGNIMLMPDGRLALIDFGQVCLWSGLSLVRRLLPSMLPLKSVYQARIDVGQVYAALEGGERERGRDGV